MCLHWCSSFERWLVVISSVCTSYCVGPIVSLSSQCMTRLAQQRAQGMAPVQLSGWCGASLVRPFHMPRMLSSPPPPRAMVALEAV